MTPKFYAGQALPGSETRTQELVDAGLSRALGVNLAPGTFNVSLLQEPDLGYPEHVIGHYRLWPCRIATEGMIKRDEPGIPGWVIRFMGERLPASFVEIVSEVHLRTALKKQNFPAFPVEIGLNCMERPRNHADSPKSSPNTS